MKSRPNIHEIFCKRLKQARLSQGLSQKSLGIAVGLDEFVASTCINRYEKGIHQVDLDTAQRCWKCPSPIFMRRMTGWRR